MAFAQRQQAGVFKKQLQILMIMALVKNRYRLVFLLFCFCFLSALSGQEGSSTTFSNVVPPSPTPASLAKAVEVPVNLASGTPSIDIPLYTLQGKKLSLPISLSYHAGGIRVEETAGWAGLGWSLNAGGVITRTVRGLPDESPNGFLNYDYQSSLGQSTLDGINSNGYAASVTDLALEGIGLGRADSEPDIFTFSFPGGTGKIVFDNNGNSLLIPYQDIQVTPFFSNGGEWILATSDGTRYFFGSHETSNTNSECIGSDQPSSGQFVSSWYLTEIQSSDGSSILTFSYEPDIVEYDVRQSETVFLPYYAQGTVESTLGEQGAQGFFSSAQVSYNTSSSLGCYRLPSSCVSEVFVEAKNLSEIESEYFIARFFSSARSDLKNNTGKKLDSLTIISKHDGSALRKFEFQYDYFVSTESVPGAATPDYLKKRLKLTGIKETGGDGDTSMPPYQFGYEESVQLPPRNSFAQDHWGFYNGEGDNETLIPKDFNFLQPLYAEGSNRNPNGLFSKAGSLTEIVYPASGKTSLEYEPHVYGYKPEITGFMAPDELVQVGDSPTDRDFTNNEQLEAHRVSINITLRG